ncbi:sigma-70 family RNA polymerase sigma factor [Mumia sp. DW29H23]|uniref:sigma-70 family RNA polymerase sigma factor n=1 Tax=Mumia sp. DW29H23 TaxID=3421241 RepID=UPI003D686DA1
MTDPTADPTLPSDAELISAVRAGDNDAYGVLFERHRDAAQRMARQLVRGGDADDLVSEAFIRVLDQLRAGSGPDVAFRAYLLTAIRRLHIDRVRAEKRVQPSDDLERYDGGVEFDDTAVAAFESSAAAQAFAALPERWQLVLWHLDVEGAKPADIAPMLGMTANGVSALAYRAREGLRQSYLQVHLADTADEECRWTTEHLGAYVRQGLGKRETTKVREHLDGCARCTAVYLELVEVNSGLRGLLAPVLLGAVGLGYVADVRAHAAAGTAGSTGATAATGSGGSSSWAGTAAGRARDWVTAAPAHGVAAAGVTLGVVGAAVTGTLLFITLGMPSSPTSDETTGGPEPSLPGPSQSAPEGGPDPRVQPDASAPTPVVPSSLPGLIPPGLPSFPPDLPVADEPGADEPGTDEPGTDEPGTDEPGTDDPGTTDPRTPEETEPTEPQPTGPTPTGPTPTPTEPTPTEPTPTEPTPTEPTPTEPTPTEPTPVRPATPGGLALSDDPEGVTLRWSAVAGADGYQVYRSASTGVAAGRFAVSAAVVGELVSGPDPLTGTSFVDSSAPNGGRVLYEVVAVNRGGASDAATLGPIRLPTTTRLSVRPIGFGTRCVDAGRRVGTASTRLSDDCGSATVWRVWDGGKDSGWWTLRALTGPTAGSCLTSASTPLVSTVGTAPCTGGTRQEWGFDPSATSAQQVANRARPGQVLDATTASLGGPLFTVPRITNPQLDRNQRFSALLDEIVASVR